ncbi:MAG: hypothetical protein K8F91_20885 [Candidatus Obscuribacterales bacterium]|nr:hypothetical protein [Candidatus Obscuribacterales bacterium]
MFEIIRSTASIVVFASLITGAVQATGSAIGLVAPVKFGQASNIESQVATEKVVPQADVEVEVVRKKFNSKRVLILGGPDVIPM